MSSHKRTPPHLRHHAATALAVILTSAIALVLATCAGPAPPPAPQPSAERFWPP